MKIRQLGNSGLTVSALGIGAMNLSFGTGKAVEESEGVRVLRATVERGINFFDTAQAYGRPDLGSSSACCPAGSWPGYRPRSSRELKC